MLDHKFSLAAVEGSIDGRERTGAGAALPGFGQGFSCLAGGNASFLSQRVSHSLSVSRATRRSLIMRPSRCCRGFE